MSKSDGRFALAYKAMLAASMETDQPKAAAGQAGRDDHTGADWKAARERVKGKHPRAYSTRVGLKLWKIYDIDRLHVLGSGPTEDAAWIDAAGRV